MKLRFGLLPVFVVTLALFLVGCTGDWATWGNGLERHGENTSETELAPSNVASLQEKWAVDLSGVVNSAPILAHNIDVNGTRMDLLYTGSENGVFYAVSTNGAIVWSRTLGSVSIACPFFPAGDHGVTASAVFDSTRNRVYAVSGDGFVYALDASDGTVVPGWPIPLTSTPTREVVWSAPTLVGDHLYYEIASHCDTRPYHGRIVDIDPQTHSIMHTFYVTGSADGPDGGGIWGWGGVSVDPADGDVYVATGNSFATPENSPYADSVVRLSSSLAVKTFHTPTLGIRDDDFGSTPVLFQKDGCPRQLIAMQKNGSLYLYDRDSLADGPRQRIDFSKSNLIGVVAYSSATEMVYAVNGKGSTNGSYIQGVAAFRFDAGCKLQLAWQTPLPVLGGTAPSVANGVVYVAGGSSNKVYALRATTGEMLWDSGASVAGRAVAQPIVVDGRLYAGAYDNKLHAWGL